MLIFTIFSKEKGKFSYLMNIIEINDGIMGVVKVLG